MSQGFQSFANKNDFHYDLNKIFLKKTSYKIIDSKVKTIDEKSQAQQSLMKGL